MPATEIPRLVADLIEATEDIIEAYDKIKDLRDLPEAFQELNKWLPLVEETLREAKTPAKKVKPGHDASELETRLSSCGEKTDKLLEMFQKVAKKSTKLQEYDASAYRSIAIKLGKHRAEALMVGILEDLEVLAAHPVFQAAMQKQVEPLSKAREQLENVPPSLLDSDLEEEQARTVSQSGNWNRQFNNFGTGVMKNVDGHYFEAKGDQNFGIIPPRESATKQGR
ncbi:hypothetical protein QBC42DRAFT_259785 [Cladorrhinum samala]|uniref:NACHT-NTPase and P-loop NTPases N-terminal domain-containing protein n=1 Tax=Cladorrhinum samala TaxID=585594 RepID=A0AAV9I481_9PEZI|nr:hypothetical protein QBC42DRAFT_259785 [Cladorrhinum samala]